MTKQTTTVLLVSDTHINSTIGLCPPVVNLDDGGTYHASRQQRAMWESWQDFWARDWPGRKIVVFNGDIGELDTKRRSTQLVSVNKSNILDMCYKALEPAYVHMNAAIWIRGTMAHTGRAQWLEEQLAKDCDVTVAQSEGVASWYHFQGEISGCKFDIAHHARMGRLPWTEKNAAIRLAELATRYYTVELQQQPPDFIFRSHNHRYADSGGNYDTFAVCMPCWQLKTEYVYRIGGEWSVPQIGGYYVIIEDGEVVKHNKVIYKPKARRVWALKI